MSLDKNINLLEMEKLPREIRVKIPGGVTGTLAIPHAADLEGDAKYQFASPTNRIALLLHGQGGHRDYCYQKLVAHRLAAELGMYSFRIDFRGCGDSDDYEDQTLGRTLELDTIDIQNSVSYVLDGSKNELGIDFELAALIAHSRGSVAMFLWAMEQDKLSITEPEKAVIVPNLINMSARFDSKTVYDRYPTEDNTWEYLLQTGLRYGKWEKYRIPKNEIDELSKPDLTKLRNLSLKWSVLSVYGMEDDIIPKIDSAGYANHLNRGPYSHELQLIPGADHNFYGVEPLEDPDDADLINPYNLPLNKNKLVNYNYLAAAYILRYLQPEAELTRFLHLSNWISKVSRWKLIDGISNFRDIGGWEVAKPRFGRSDNLVKYSVRPSFIFRSANTNSVTEKGMQGLKDLNIKVIYDLRSNQECKKDGFPENLDRINVERVFNPVFANEDASPQALALKTANLLTHWDTYVHLYDNMLDEGYRAFQKMFQHIRDYPDAPFVFHCTAGKDRTGIFSMLVLRFVGVDKHTIAREYDLTTHGLKPDHPKITKAFEDGLERFRSKMNLSDLEQMVAHGRKGWSLEVDGLQNLLSSRYEAMLATIDLLDEKYGGVVNYMKGYLGFTDQELQTIFDNLVTTEPQDASSKTNIDAKF